MEQFYNFLNTAGREEKYQSKRDLVKWINLIDINIFKAFFYHRYLLGHRVSATILMNRSIKCRAKLLKTFAIVGELIDCDLRESFEKKKIYLLSTLGARNKNFPRFEGKIRELYRGFFALFLLPLKSKELAEGN